MSDNKEKTNEYYTLLPPNVRYDDRLTGDEKVLFSEILFLSQKNGYCFASNSYLSNLFGVTKVCISNRISNLKKYRYIDTEIIYKENSKQIEKRKIYILNNTLLKESLIGINKDFKTPIKQPNGEGIKRTFKDNITRDNITSTNIMIDDRYKESIDKIVDKWNSIEEISNISSIKTNKRYDKLVYLINEFGDDKVLQAIENINNSSYLKGQVNNSRPIEFDWFLAPNRFIDVLENKYKDHKKQIAMNEQERAMAEAEEYVRSIYENK